jgi:hypothetical protein
MPQRSPWRLGNAHDDFGSMPSFTKNPPSSPEPLQILNPYSCLLLFRSSLCSGSLTWGPRPRSFVKKCSVSGPCSLVRVVGVAGGSAASAPSQGAPSLVSASICILACEEPDGEVGSVTQHVDFKTSTVRSFAEVVKFGCIPSSPRGLHPPLRCRWLSAGVLRYGSSLPRIRLIWALLFVFGPRGFALTRGPNRSSFMPRCLRLVWALLVVCWADLQLV